MATTEKSIDAYKRVKEQWTLLAGAMHEAGENAIHAEMASILLSDDMDTLNRHFSQQTRQMIPMGGPHHGKLTLEQTKKFLESLKNEA